MQAEDKERKILQDEIASLLARGSSSTILGLDGIGSDVFLLETLDSGLKKSNMHSVRVNCSELVERTPVYFYRSLLYQFIQFLDKKGIEKSEIEKLSRNLMETDLFILVNVIQDAISISLENTGKAPITMVITNLTKMVDLDTAFYSGLRSLRNKDKDRLAFLFRDTYKFVHSFSYQNTGELFELIRSNLRWIPLPKGGTYRKNIEDNEIKFNCSVSESDRDRIYRLTNGHAGLVKYSVAFYSRNGVLDEEQMILDDAIKVRLDRILDELSSNEKDLMSRISHGEKIKSDSLLETHLIDSHLLISESSDDLQISIPLLRLYLDKLNGSHRKKRSSKSLPNAEVLDNTKLFIDGQNIYLEGKIMDAELTKNEFSVLELLSEKNGTVVSRDDVAAVMWGPMFEEKYSDWAIDQTVSRLRKKLGDSGYDPKLIKTVRGRGFKLIA